MLAPWMFNSRFYWCIGFISQPIAASEGIQSLTNRLGADQFMLIGIILSFTYLIT